MDNEVKQKEQIATQQEGKQGLNHNNVCSDPRGHV
jgi:hypothetical protein